MLSCPILSYFAACPLHNVGDVAVLSTKFIPSMQQSQKLSSNGNQEQASKEEEDEPEKVDVEEELAPVATEKSEKEGNLEKEQEEDLEEENTLQLEVVDAAPPIPKKEEPKEISVGEDMSIVIQREFPDAFKEPEFYVLQRSLLKLAKTSMNIPDGILSIDWDGIIMSFNIL